MKTAEIRKKLIEEIRISENKNLLEEFYFYLNRENKTQNAYKLNKEQRFAINEAHEQIKNREYLTSEQANQEIEEWLKK